MVGAAASEGYQDDISDHKCLKVILKLEDLPPPVQLRNQQDNVEPPVISSENFKHLLSQAILRRMANSEETRNCMLEQEKVIGVPTYQYFYNQVE